MTYRSFSSEEALADTLFECVMENTLWWKDAFRLKDYFNHNKELARELTSSIAQAVFGNTTKIMSFVKIEVPTLAKHYLGPRGTRKKLQHLVMTILKHYANTNNLFWKHGIYFYDDELSKSEGENISLYGWAYNFIKDDGKSEMWEDEIFNIGCMSLMRLQVFRATLNEEAKGNPLCGILEAVLNGATKERAIEMTRELMERGKADKLTNICYNLEQNVAKLNDLIYSLGCGCTSEMMNSTSYEMMRVISYGLEYGFKTNVPSPLKSLAYVRVRGLDDDDDSMKNVLKEGFNFYVDILTELAQSFIKK